MALKLEDELPKRDIDMMGCFNYARKIFHCCLEGLALGKAKARKEIRDMLDSLVSRTELGHELIRLEEVMKRQTDEDS